MSIKRVLFANSICQAKLQSEIQFFLKLTYRQTPSPLISAATSPTFPSYLMSKEKPNSIIRAQTDGAFVFQPPVCLVQSKTRAKAKSEIDKGGSKIFENYKSTVTKRTQHPEGNMQRRIRRTTSCGSLEIKGLRTNQVLNTKLYYEIQANQIRYEW